MTHYYSKTQEGKLELKKISAVLRGKKLEFFTGAGVFSKDKIDNGSYVLLQNAIVKKTWHVLDLGCGYGAVGISIAKSEDAKVLMADVNERAVFLSGKNIELNKVDAEAKESDVFSDIPEKFDTILLNPPQSAGKALCFRMIEESKEHLKKNGLLQLVARPKKGGKTLAEKMKEVFGNVEITARGHGFAVYVSKN